MHSSTCSTPFGINESNTLRNRACHCRSILCSTPFGINESNTLTNTGLPLAATCAQRLSASTNQTPGRARTRFPALRCAQRLSASTNQTQLGRWLVNKMTSGAQRLSASTNQTHYNLQKENPISFVLNAFRHQRIKHI